MAFLSQLKINPLDVGVDCERIQEKMYILKQRDIMKSNVSDKAARLVKGKINTIVFIKDIFN